MDPTLPRQGRNYVITGPTDQGRLFERFSPRICLIDHQRIAGGESAFDPTFHQYEHKAFQGNTKRPWTPVTGASDGISRQLAAELATHGFDIVVHGRNNAKLATVEGELRREFPAREFRSLAADLGKMPRFNCFAAAAPPSGGAVDLDSIVVQLRGLQLTVVVNTPSALNRRQSGCGRGVVVPYLLHGLPAAIVELLSEFVRANIPVKVTRI
ncbi:hypothetical protein M0657_003750 [Pyricularia oryzae]|uniref:Uncharacterized protein n=1 Tax=Pyricularia oryzae TaxID=318829 RepID=A0A4P7NJ15_PYROR|nr:hypothetical protein M9X92_007593 [Pyricularia oryzae]KAI7926517.1 hypothetical protein M0657_003750 [Pyricularia oryzae]QBZ62035.1 hypothetical protein PoMZ_10909 [Pyricularia oryzae]